MISTNDTGFWRPGDVVLMRYLLNRPGDVVAPVRIVHDDDEYTATYISPGTPLKVHATRDGQRFTRDFPLVERFRLIAGFADADWTTNHCLALLRPDRMCAIYLFWREHTWEFAGYYGNIQAPPIRTVLGIDTADYLLDVVIDPDFGCQWKDEDEWELARDHGLIERDLIDEIRREGERIIADAEARAWPFNAGFETWRPDPVWTIPQLPPNWDEGLIYPE